MGSEFVTNLFDMRAGEAGTGLITVTNGGKIKTTGGGDLTAGQLAGATGTIAVDGGIVEVGDRVLIGNGGTGTFTAVNGSQVSTGGQFILGESAGSVGTAIFDDSTMSINVATQDLIVGRFGRGQMTIQNGSSVSVANDVFVSLESGNTEDNRLVITGGSMLSFGNGGTDDEMFIANRGNGSLLLDGGSTIFGRNMVIGNQAGSSGVATIDGAGTTANLGFLNVGNQGAGTATVSGGAQVNLNTTENFAGNLFVGNVENGTGTLTITGTGSAVTANKRSEIGGAGPGGNGTVNVENGGALTASGGVLGLGDVTGVSAGTVNVDGAGSSWDATGADLFVGYRGAGHVNITNSGAATTGPLRLGSVANDEDASILVDGPGSSLTVNGTSLFGEDRAATVDVSNDALLTTNGLSAIGDGAGADGAVVTVDNATWTHGGGRLRVGNLGGSAAAPATLRVENGGTVTNSSSLYVADGGTASHGLVEIVGAGSSISVSSTAVIGDAGPGTLRVRDGGSFTLTSQLDISGLSSGRGTVVVSGARSSLSVLGDATNVGRNSGSIGTLTLADGGTMTTDDVNVAREPGSNGTVNLNDGGLLTLRDGKSLYVSGKSLAGGTGGTATMNIQGGEADVSLGSVVINPSGTLSLSSGTLRLNALTRAAGSSFEFSGGKLAISGNRVLDAGLVSDIFNANPTLNNGMTLEVAGTTSLNADLRLNGGTFSVGAIADVSKLDWDAGTFALTGANLAVAPGGLFGDQLVLSSNQHLGVGQQVINDGLIFSSGTITTGAGLVNNGDLVLTNADVNGQVTTPAGSTVTVVGTVDFNGPVSGAGNFFGPGMANFQGGYNPGDSPAVVSFEGNVALGAANTLTLEIGGTDNSTGAQYDQLIVDGTLQLDGTLQIDLIDLGGGAYPPQLGDSFTIVTTGGGISGLFADMDFPTLAGGLGWQLLPQANALQLKVVASAGLGDFNGDGNWDCADVDQLVAAIAAGSNDLAFDMNGDSAITLADLNDATSGWLVVGGANNSAVTGGSPFLAGDANLDGVADVSDFNVWNNNKFSSGAAWCRGDFNADGFVDVSDFNVWNGNKFQSSGNAVAVPEPATWGLLVWSLLGCGWVMRKR